MTAIDHDPKNCPPNGQSTCPWSTAVDLAKWINHASDGQNLGHLQVCTHCGLLRALIPNEIAPHANWGPGDYRPVPEASKPEDEPDR